MIILHELWKLLSSDDYIHSAAISSTQKIYDLQGPGLLVMYNNERGANEARLFQMPVLDARQIKEDAEQNRACNMRQRERAMAYLEGGELHPKLDLLCCPLIMRDAVWAEKARREFEAMAMVAAVCSEKARRENVVKTASAAETYKEEVVIRSFLNFKSSEACIAAQVALLAAE